MKLGEFVVPTRLTSSADVKALARALGASLALADLVEKSHKYGGGLPLKKEAAASSQTPSKHVGGGRRKFNAVIDDYDYKLTTTTTTADQVKPQHYSAIDPIAVMLAERRHDRLPVAIKQYRHDSNAGRHEARMLSQVQDLPTAVKLIESWEPHLTIWESALVVLVMERLQPLPPFASMSLPFIGNAIEQLLRAVDELHRRNIVHGDIKPSNIMMLQGNDGTVQLKLIDFELAQNYVAGLGLKCHGTMGYIAPELMNSIPFIVGKDDPLIHLTRSSRD
jgi:hypothetical protein